MNINEYQEKSKRTMHNDMSYSEQISNMVFGTLGEMGEVVDLLKKHRYQGHRLDKDKLTEELGDVMFYMVNLCTLYGIEMSDVLEGNINKLLKRYPDGFDIERSVNR